MIGVLLLAALQDVEIQAEDLPYEHELKVSPPGYVQVEVVEGPEKFRLHASFPDVEGGFQVPTSGQARVTGSPLKIVVKDRWNNKHEGKLTLRFTFTPEPDDSEPNNTAETARKAEFGEHELAIMPKGDVDVLAFEAPGPGYVICSTPNGPKGLTLRAIIRDADGKELGRNQARVPEAGPVRVAVADRWGNFASTDPFKVRVEFVSETDEGEAADAGGGRPVELGTHEAAIMPAGDKDLFTLEIAEPGYLVCSLPDPPKGLTFRARVRNELGRVLGTNVVRVDVPGKVGVAVQDRWGNFASTKPFKIEFKFVPEFDFMEPNDTPAHAARILAGSWVRTALYPGGDVDHFSIEVGEPGLLMPEVLEAPFRLKWGLHDAEGRVVSSSPPFAVEAGEHVLSVRPRWNDSKPEPFAFRVYFRKQLDELESNDEEPAKIEVGRTYRVTLPSSKDIDKLAVELDEPGLLRFGVVGEAPLKCVFRRGKRKGLPLYVRGEGRIGVELVPESRWSSPEAFRIEVTRETEIDPGEPNDSLQTAREVRLGEAVKLYSWPAGDEDWFRVEASGPGHLFAILHGGYAAAVGHGLKPVVDVRDAEGKEIAKLPQGGGDIRRTVRIESARTCYVRVRGVNSSSRLPYHLTVYFLEDGRTADETAAGVVLYVLGLELKEEAEAELKMMARTAHGSFVRAEKAEEITPRLEEAVRKASEKVEEIREREEAKARAAEEKAKSGTKKPEEGGPVWIWILVALIAAGGLGALVVLGRKKTARP